MKPLSLLLLIAAAAQAAAPSITGVTNAADFQPNIASATWVAVFGSNLSTTTDAWSDFPGGALPTTLDGVSVTINNIPAYVAFVSPGQINVLAPDDATLGSVPVVVTNAAGTSNTVQAAKKAVAPAFFTYSQTGGTFAAVQEAGTYTLVAPINLFGAAVPTARAIPGQTLILYATGLGPTSPAIPTSHLVTTPAPVAAPVQITFAGQTLTPSFAGLIGAGLYQINIAVPLVANGNEPITVTVGGATSVSELIPVDGPPLSVGNQTHPTLAGCVSGSVDSITYSAGPIVFGESDDVSIAGKDLCQTCNVKNPIFPEFAARMDLALRRKKNIDACYDANGIIYQITLHR